ncbi:MAG: AraC family transcriptional regulator [Cyanobacteriota bacterium]|nr:AraC family transcriptional regulator [Cyanobacteriota bacterium]
MSTSFAQLRPDLLVSASHHLAWRGLEVMTFQGIPNESSFPPLDRHLLLLHQQAHLTVTAKFADQQQQGSITPLTNLSLIPAFCPNQWAWPETADFRVLHLYLHPDWLTQVAPPEIPTPSLAPQIAISDPQLEYLSLALQAEVETGGLTGSLFVESLTMALAQRLLHRSAPHPPQRFPGQLSTQQRQTVLDYLHSHLDQPLHLAEMARLLDLSPHYFARLFKQTVGIPLHQYVIALRVDRAVPLIQAGQLPLNQIAARVGFAHQSHMTHHVKRQLGLTPSQLRNSPPSNRPAARQDPANREQE